ILDSRCWVEQHPGAPATALWKANPVGIGQRRDQRLQGHDFNSVAGFFPAWRQSSNAKMKIRTLIVDDEALGRKRVRQLLESESECEIVGECSDGQEAVAAMRSFTPDLVF